MDNRKSFFEVIYLMILYNDKSYTAKAPSVVALGCFDGVHKGHRAVIERAIAQAKELELSSAVWTFSEPSKNFFTPGAIPLITSKEEKCKLIEALGVDLVLCLDFDESIANLSPEEFFNDILVGRLSAAHIVCGFNYSFGSKGAGNTELLSKLCEEAGIGLTVLPAVLMEGIDVSSSLIRGFIESGELEQAEKYLGYPFSITAEVIGGKRLARKLGFPTVNITPPAYSVIPKHGVYLTSVSFEGSDGELFGITNIGMRPTVESEALCAETHIFDFDGDLYGKELRVNFLRFIRPERLFDSIEDLKSQVEQDIEIAKKIMLEIK